VNAVQTLDDDPTWYIPGVFSIDSDLPTQPFVEHVAGPRVLAVLGGAPLPWGDPAAWASF
jgi:hypothetical protein